MNLCLKSPSLSYFLPVSKSTSEAREDCSRLGVWLVVVLFWFGLSSDSRLLSPSASTQQKSGRFRTIINQQSTDISLSFHFESYKRFKEDWIYYWSESRVFYLISWCKSTIFLACEINIRRRNRLKSTFFTMTAITSTRRFQQSESIKTTVGRTKTFQISKQSTSN